MGSVIKWLFRITASLIGVLLFGLWIAYLFAARSLPDYDEDFTLAGIAGPVEIVRDNSNVPHIFGETDPDVYFALGFAHAQDRFWQMTMLRRTVQGRLSELFGPRTLEIDKLLRRLDLHTLARESVAAQDSYAKAALEAYAAGVNAWLEQINDGARGRGAPEMWLFNHPVAPWQPADSIAISKLMAVQLSGHLQDEVLRARLSLMAGADALPDLMPDAPGQAIAALPSYAALVPDAPRYHPNTRMADTALSPVAARELAGASNAFAAGPTRSTTGSTLLANDPHLELTAPAIWYLARLELETGGVIGATIPGIPVVLSGRNTNLAWGVTSAYLDDQDVFIEEVNPRNPDEYRSKDGWTPFRTRDSIIPVAGAPAVTIKLQWTENGPVLPPDQYDLGTIRPPGHVTTVGWTVFNQRNTNLTAALGLMRAGSVEAGVAAMEGYVAPAQNLMLADRNSIGFKVVGRIPDRDAGHQSRGRLPTFGYLPENQWKGYQPYANNPEYIDPEGGILGNTNNKTVDRPFPDHVSYHWGDTQRINRWRRLMQVREVHTRESFIEAQLDTVSFTARALLPLVGQDLWFTGEAAPDGTPERKRQVALEMLAEWNGEMNEHLPEPLIYATWMRHLQERLIRDELGPLADEFTHVEPLFIERVFRDTEGAARWCDVIQSAPQETCTDVARIALDEAIIWLDETYGTTLESLRWGDAHEATHDHPVLGDAPFLNWFVNIRQSTSGGDNTLMRGKTAGVGPDPFQNVHAAGYRGVYDLADPDSSVFVISTGQSGHPLSRHYDDLGERWRQGEYVPMALDPDLARAAAVGVTTLTPATR
jgi:penicillin amidase